MGTPNSFESRASPRPRVSSMRGSLPNARKNVSRETFCMRDTGGISDAKPKRRGSVKARCKRAAGIPRPRSPPGKGLPKGRCQKANPKTRNIAEPAKHPETQRQLQNEEAPETRILPNARKMFHVKHSKVCERCWNSESPQKRRTSKRLRLCAFDKASSKHCKMFHVKHSAPRAAHARHKKKRRPFETDAVRQVVGPPRLRSYFAAPMRQIVVPQSGHLPFVMGLPFFVVLSTGSLIDIRIVSFDGHG